MNNFTEEEVRAAILTRDTILLQDIPELKSVYMAGEINMWDELRRKNKLSTSASKDERQKLFETIINVTGFTPLESDMDEIQRASFDSAKEFWINKIKEELRKQMLNVTYENGYPIKAVPQATIEGLNALMRAVGQNEW